jgi:hypothetical protein
MLRKLLMSTKQFWARAPRLDRPRRIVASIREEQVREDTEGKRCMVALLRGACFL